MNPRNPTYPGDLGKLVVRADADSTIGSGHVMRCLALGQAWQQAGGAVLFVLSAGSEPLHQRLRDEGVEIRQQPGEAASSDDADFTRVHSVDASALIVDGYHFTPEFRSALRRPSQPFVIIDDCGDLGPYQCDLVVNPSWLHPEPLYPTGPQHPQALVGNRYALLRQEFRDHGRESRVTQDNRVLVTLGGADPGGVTPRVLAALQGIERPLEVTVVVGGSNPQARQLDTLVATSHHEWKLAYNVTHMGNLMTHADLAITAGGGTCWELAHLGVPSVVVVVADNQRGVVSGLESRDAIVNLGWYQDLTESHIRDSVQSLLEDTDRRTQMSSRGRELIDGQGPYRVVDELVRMRP